MEDENRSSWGHREPADTLQTCSRATETLWEQNRSSKPQVRKTEFVSALGSSQACHSPKELLDFLKIPFCFVNLRRLSRPVPDVKKVPTTGLLMAVRRTTQTTISPFFTGPLSLKERLFNYSSISVHLLSFAASPQDGGGLRGSSLCRPQLGLPPSPVSRLPKGCPDGRVLHTFLLPSS